MLYEDDFEFEEQPADVRDRAIGGKPGGGGRGGRTPRGYEPRRAPAQPRVRQEMPEDAKPALDLLRDILERMGVGPVEIEYISRTEGEYLEITGAHLGMLIGRHGNTLEALNLALQQHLQRRSSHESPLLHDRRGGLPRAACRPTQESGARDARTLRARSLSAKTRTDASVGTQDHPPGARRLAVGAHRIRGRRARAARGHFPQVRVSE